MRSSHSPAICKQKAVCTKTYEKLLTYVGKTMVGLLMTLI